MEQKRKLTNKDLVLLLLYADNCSPIEGRTRFQKLCFEFENNILKKYGFDKEFEENLFNFEAYHYGPFSKKLYEILDFLINISVIEINKKNIKNSEEGMILDELKSFFDEDEKEDITIPVHEIEIFSLSDRAKKFVEDKLMFFYKNEHKDVLDKLKHSFNTSSLHDILKYNYTKYPEMTVNSKIRDKVLSDEI